MGGVSGVGDGTRTVRAGLPAQEQGQPLVPGPVFAAPFHLRGDPAAADYVYGRYGNPTWTRVEAALGELEQAETVLFASGMAACVAALYAHLRPGAVLVLPDDCYMGVRGFAERHLPAVEVRTEPTASLHEAPLDGAAVVWVETPSNPGLELCDLRLLAERAHAAGAVLVADNTTPTPLGQRPLDLGADVSVTSATKSLAGHADLVIGYVATRDEEAAAGLRDWRRLAGPIPGPFEAWLLHRSLATLELRLARQCENALRIAELMADRDDVQGVRYPGLPSDPAHALAREQMSRFGSLVCFDLVSRERAEGFLAACRLVTEATSFGGVYTTAERRARWRGDAVPEGFIRLSAGCEDGDDLVADLTRALDSL